MTSHNNELKTDRRKALGIIGASTISGMAAIGTLNASSANAATIARTDLIKAIGFDPILSQLPPNVTSVANLPVYWIQESDVNDGNIDVTPISPIFDDNKYVWIIPNGVIGIDYQDQKGNSLLPGQPNIISAAPYNVQIKAIALPGYEITKGSITSWSHIFPAFTSGQILTSDTFDGNSGNALSGRATDGHIGGVPGTKWGSDSVAEPFHIDGKNNLVNTGSTGMDYLNVGKNDLHASIKISLDRTKLNGNVTIGIGGTSKTPAVGFIIDKNGWQAFVTTNASNNTKKIVESAIGSDSAPDGFYQIEILGNQFGYKAPAMDNMDYYDATNDLDQSIRGPVFQLATTSSVVNTVTVNGFQIVAITSQDSQS